MAEYQNNNSVSIQGYAKQQEKKRNKKMIITGMILLILAFFVLNVSDVEFMKDKGFRPQHCDDVGCVDEYVFEDLPDYPKDFEDIKVIVMTGRMMDMDKIDEAYWKQPEFYEYSFEKQCLPYYTGKSNIKFSAGSGGYPADLVIKNVSRGDVLNAKTFWHAGCGIHKYQAFQLETIYPEKMSVRLSDIKVEQDPSIAEACFTIRMNPESIVLSPTSPKYTYNWTKDVEAVIIVSDDCPSGNYGVQFMPASLSSAENEELLLKYGASKLSGMYVGGLWQLAIEVI